MDLSVIVPTRDRAHLLVGCIEALGRQVGDVDHEIVVVDNGSRDATQAVVREQARRVRNLRAVVAPTAGVNRARNRGVLESDAELIAFIDDDEVVPPDYVSAAVSLLAAHPGAAGVGGPCRDAATGAGRFCAACGGLGDVEAPVDAEGRAGRLLGGNMVIRRSAFDSVGLFDEALSGRGDETEWFHRAREAGLWFHYDPDLWVEHRRDVFSARELLWTQFRQGRARPLAAARMGEPFRPRPGRAVRAMAHGVRYRCVRGGIVAARDLGAIAGMIRHPSTLRRHRS